MTGASRTTAALLIPLAALLACQPAEAEVAGRVAGHILTVKGGPKEDRVRVLCGADANVKVNGRDPRDGPVPCERISEVDAVTGAGDDRVDLSGIDDSFGQRELPGFGRGTGAAAKLGTGNDTYIGSASAFNLVMGGSGNDRIRGGDRRDHLSGGPGDDLIRGLPGDDLLLGGTGSDRILGGPGDDLISGNAGADSLLGGPGADLIGGGGGDDRLFGGAGPDRLYGGAGDDRLFGGSGDDLLVGGPGKDLLRGGPGENTLVQGLPKARSGSSGAGAASGPGVTISISVGRAVPLIALRDAGGSAAVTVLTVNGGPAANRIVAFVGPTGRLTLTSPEGMTAPQTPAGQCTQDSAQQISCDPGYVQVIVGDLGEGDDTFAASRDLPVMVGGVIDGQRRPLAGGTGRDRIIGGAAPDLLEGGPGPDTLIGRGGDDLLIGGGGTDTLRGGRGRDSLFAGSGPDQLDGGPGRDLCHGGRGDDSATRCEIVRSVP